MNKARTLTGVVMLALAALACITTSTQTSPPINVETVVAETMIALTPGNNSAEEVIATSPSRHSDLLPRPLYYLATDDSDFLQVYRLEPDGQTTHQMTFEPSNVTDYDVSSVDGSIVYVSNNQLLLVEADGSNRHMLIDGGPVDKNAPYLSNINNPLWSPNGRSIAYHHRGLNFYDVQMGQDNLALEDVLDATYSFPREIHYPLLYSPDGSKLLLNVGHHEGGVYSIYDISGSTMVRLSEGLISCCSESWTPDSSAVFAASHISGMISPGLWRIDSDGTLTTLLSGQYPGPLDFVFAPQLAQDGQLYYFYNSHNEEDFVDRLPLYLVRSAPDGVTDRKPLFDTPFEGLYEVLWEPDTSFAIVVIHSDENIQFGGVAKIVYTNGSTPIHLIPYARDLRWGP